MKIRALVQEDFLQYKKPSMFIGTCYCTWKCCREYGDIKICQNSNLAKEPIRYIEDSKLVNRYLENDITKAIVFGGLEPLEQYNELDNFIDVFRKYSDDDIVIYTGYNEEEVGLYISELKKYKNIIIKFGRYIPNDTSHYDNILGVELASSNQYAKKIS